MQNPRFKIHDTDEFLELVTRNAQLSKRYALCAMRSAQQATGKRANRSRFRMIEQNRALPVTGSALGLNRHLIAFSDFLFRS
jgi:hypothetical protein